MTRTGIAVSYTHLDVYKRQGVPLVMVKFDYQNRRMRVGPVIWPSGDYATDLPLIQDEFADIKGRHPELMLGLKGQATAKEPVP